MICHRERRPWRSRPRRCAICSSMEVLVDRRTLRRFSNIGSRRDVGRRSLSILDAVDPAFVGLFGNQIETELLADNTSEKSAHRMLLPMSGGLYRSHCTFRPAPPALH